MKYGLVENVIELPQYEFATVVQKLLRLIKLNHTLFIHNSSL